MTMTQKEIPGFQHSVDRLFHCMKQAAILEIDFYDDTPSGRNAYHNAIFYALTEFMSLQLIGFHEDDVKSYLKSLGEVTISTWKTRQESKQVDLL